MAATIDMKERKSRLMKTGTGFAAATRTAAMVLILGLGVTAAHAHSGKQDDKHRQGTSISTEEHPFGKEGDARKATRTIAIEMDDRMRFTPSEITVKEGETIRFVIRNKGKMLHEIVLGTMADLKEHAEMMKKHPEMEHDEPYMSHVNPGKKGNMVWQFTRPGEFYYACLIPGHFEAGMMGTIKVTKR
jgi:uncharacterized cupredoxin-like copper-binding protein